MYGTGGHGLVAHEPGERVALVDQVGERHAAQIEVAPPRGLALAPVVEQEMREQAALGLRRCVVVAVRPDSPSVRRSIERRDVGHPLRRAVLLLGLGLAEVVEVDAELAPPPRAASSLEQPVAQRQRRAAVLLVVGADRLEQLVVAGLEPGLVGDDRAAALADALLQAREAVVALELLQRVALLADLQALPHDGVEVDEDLVAQQLVDLVLARRVL